MKAHPIRLCVTCEKQHDTGVENKLTGEFNRIDECIDCLMSRSSFKFETREITLDDLKPNMSYDEMQRELGETMIKIIHNSFNNVDLKKINEGNDLIEEWGCSAQITVQSAGITTAPDLCCNEVKILCKCGNEASSVIMGKEAWMGLCNKCQYGDV